MGMSFLEVVGLVRLRCDEDVAMCSYHTLVLKDQLGIFD